MIDYKLTGRKGSRQIVKTVDISEESYQMWKKPKSTSGFKGFSTLADAYNAFGGNCYRGIVSDAVENLFAAVIKSLEENGHLKVEAENAYKRIVLSLFPIMCATVDDSGDNVVDGIRFFNDDSDEVRKTVAECLTDECAERFMKEFDEVDADPAGEFALCVLMYLAG